MTQSTSTSRSLAEAPIRYHHDVKRCFSEFAYQMHVTPRRFWELTELAIRTRPSEAYIAHESDRARGSQPDIFTLGLSEKVSVMYTIEEDGVVVWGYGLELDREPLDDADGGFCFHEASWL